MQTNILIVGATGRVGQRLMTELQLDPNNHVVGTSSHPQTEPNMLQLDLHADFETIRAAMAPFEIVYFTAGSRGQDLLQIDLNGNMKVAQAAEQLGVTRFIQLSSAAALNQTMWQQAHFASLQDYNVARYFADLWVLNSQLSYTILQAGSLLDAEPTHLVNIMPVANNGRNLAFEQAKQCGNTLDDVASVLAAIKDVPQLNRKILQMENGTTPIQAALRQI